MKETLSTLSRIPLPVAIVLSVGVMCGWIPDFFRADADYLALALTATLAVGNAFALNYLNRATGVTRWRDILPMWLYLLTITAFPAIHAWWQLQAAVLLVILSVRVLHRAYREENTAHDSFLATALLLIASLFVPRVVFCVPLVWLAYVLLRAMHVRTFVASLIAVATFALYLAIAVCVFQVPCPYASVFSTAYVPRFTHFVLLGFHIVFLITMAVRVDRDSASQQALLILLFLFFLPSAAAALFFRQRDSLPRGIIFLVYSLFLAGSYAAYYLF